MTATAVLVHGAWHGARCFDRVTTLLRDEGVPVVAVDLPEHDAEPGPFSDLYGDAEQVSDVLDGIAGDVVLLGHSYGGAVITQSGCHPSVRHLFYLCAIPVDHGESCHRAGGEAAAGTSHAGRPSPGDTLVDLGDGTTTLRPEAVGPVLHGDCDEETVAFGCDQSGSPSDDDTVPTTRQSRLAGKPASSVVCART